jgi:hypothetical protein
MTNEIDIESLDEDLQYDDAFIEKKNNKIKFLKNAIENQKLIIKEKERNLRECENLLEIAMGLIDRLTTNKSMQNDN